MSTASYAIGAYPVRRSTVTAEVLCRLLEGRRLTGMDAVFGCSTTRLAAVIHKLAVKYCWNIDHVDMVVGTNDGRVTVIRAYFFASVVIRQSFDAGALEFCSSVKAARTATSMKANQAKELAHKRNVARSVAKRDPFQAQLFGGEA